MKWKLVIAAVAVAALGAVVAAVWVGSSMYERTVVADPYQSGLHHDAHRKQAETLGWTLAVDETGLVAGPKARLTVQLRGRDGGPLDGATVELRASRAGKPALDRTVRATGEGSGRYRAELPLPEAGFWDLDARVERGGETLLLAQRFQVAAAGAGAGSAPAPAAPCDAGRAPCTLDAGDLRVTLDLSPRPPVALQELAAMVRVSRGGAPLPGAAVSLELSMPGMYMGENRIVLAPADGGYAGKGVLVRCASGRRDWSAEVVVRPAGGAEARVRFPFQAAE